MIQLEELKNKKFVFIYFSREECSVCHVMKPKLKELSEHYENTEFVSIDLDEMPNASGIYSIFTIPALIVYSEGKELYRGARFFNLSEIESSLDRYYDMIFSE